jgi:fructose-1,6-bisphosphatase
MGAKRYGPANGQKKPTRNDYHQSKDELAGLPQTVVEKVPVTSRLNIFSYKSHVFAKNPALVQRYIKATKADVGGVGGHVVAADEVKSIVAKFVLDNNGYRGEPIFTSLIVTHTGDDVALTGIRSERIDMSVVDELMWDSLQAGAPRRPRPGLGRSSRPSRCPATSTRSASRRSPTSSHWARRGPRLRPTLESPVAGARPSPKPALTKGGTSSD